MQSKKQSWHQNHLKVGVKEELMSQKQQEITTPIYLQNFCQFEKLDAGKMARII